jgi:hypothetical protein
MNDDTKQVGAAIGALAFGLGAKKRLPPPPPDPHGVLIGGSKGTGAKKKQGFGAGGCSCSKRKVK